MKKVICLALALIMVLSLTACGSDSQGTTAASGNTTVAAEGETVELTFWCHQEEAWNASYEDIIAKFNEKYPNIKINVESYPYDDFESKVQTSLISKTGGADIYELWGGWGVDFAPTGALAAMPDDMANEIFEDAYACTYGSLEYEGKLYGMPMEFNIECGGLIVNTTLQSELGMTTPTTWDQLIEQAASATQYEGEICTLKGFDPVNWDGIPYLFTSMILSQGGQYLNEDGSVNFTSKEAVSAFTELASLNGKTTDMLGLTGGEDLEGFQQLYAGSALYVPRGPWAVSDGIVSFELTYGEDFEYVAMPWYGQKAAFAAETGWALGVNANSEKQDAAWKFIEFFFTDEILMSHNLACGQIPAKKSVATSADFVAAMPYAEPLIGILDNAQYLGYFNSDTFKEIINNVYTDYCTTDNYASVEDALADMEAQLNENL